MLRMGVGDDLVEMRLFPCDMIGTSRGGDREGNLRRRLSDDLIHERGGAPEEVIC